MGFSDKQVRALGRNVPAHSIKSRVSDGKELSYIEGWYALVQANRIFGFDGWDRETVETKCLAAREARGTYSAAYLARVRITVHTNDRVVVRDGHGTGTASAASVGEAHDRALKAAETDATKRALATFGKAFGLALHAGMGRPPLTHCRTDEPHRETTTHEAQKLLTDGSPVTLHQSAGDNSHGAAPEARGVASRPNGAITTPSLLEPTPGSSFGGHVDKSALTFGEPRRVRDKDHLRFVATQPCILCSATPSDAHHVRFAQPRALGRKVGDEFTVPLCRAHHRELHQGGNEAAWWHDMGVDPLELAKELWAESERQR